MNLNIKIIYEDDEVLVIWKPTDLLVHSDGRNEQLVLTDWVLKNYPEIKGIGESIELEDGEEIERPGIVHRLDKDTSGVLLITKTQESFNNLKNQFQNREIKKNYRALVYGNVKYDRKIIDTPIGRSKKNFRYWTTGREIRGKAREAITEYRLISKNEDFSYLDVFPKTGRTHQIRVHLKYDNHPIIADHLYAGKKFNREAPAENLNFTTQALHAYKIEWRNLAGEKKEAVAELPKIFENAAQKL